MRTDTGSMRRPPSRVSSNRLYDQAARLAGFGAWECDLATEDLTWTDGVYALFELPVGKVLKRAAILDLYEDRSRVAMQTMRAEAIRSGRGFVLDAEIRTWRGKARWMRLTAEVRFANGRPARLFGAKQDITSERNAWEQLRHMAERDPLTGLANRGLFDQHYRAIVDDTLNDSFVSAVVLIDVDHLKQINDRRGHGAGDECLRQVAARLQRVFTDASLVARIGGDEFAVLLRAPLDQVRIKGMLDEAIDRLCDPIIWDGIRIDVGASIGATVLGRPHMRRVSKLFAEADEALYAAKAAGRRAMRIFGEANGTSTSACRVLTLPTPNIRMMS